MNLQLGSTKNMESFATAADHSAYDLIVHPDLHGGYLSFTSQSIRALGVSNCKTVRYSWTILEQAWTFCLQFFLNADNRSLVDLKQKFLMSLHTSRRSVSSLKLINLQCRSLRIPDIISSMRMELPHWTEIVKTSKLKELAP
ncbi:uncharacterized protein [Spinacia oleracea]|uniref:Uncharacterized protein isoform X2 n=1 Tax=Spinacia oleracea TaxID=3562 RepID=A0A9R0K0W1_SPIOL|nr:uncharacterized protein LOC110793778 isoform X2 [Spinacia oleracea]XP_056686533.1 uncharacterized protein LOC110793778 isoform X2 [Spinacia oleracea]